MKKQPLQIATCARACAGFLLIQFLLLISTERPARAYIDPGSGALVWQGMLASLIGSAFYFRRIAGWVKTRLFRGGRDRSGADV